MPQDLSNLVWASARAQIRHEAFFLAAQARCKELLPTITETQHLGNLVWGLVSLGERDPELVGSMVDLIIGERVAVAGV